MAVSHGWPSQGSEGAGCLPELVGPLSEGLIWCGVPSVRYAKTPVRVTQAFGVGEPSEILPAHLPSAARPGVLFGKYAAQCPSGRLAVFLAEPGLQAPIQPPVVLGELLRCPSGITIVVAPADDDRVEVVDEISKGEPSGRALHPGSRSLGILRIYGAT